MSIMMDVKRRCQRVLIYAYSTTTVNESVTKKQVFKKNTK